MNARRITLLAIGVALVTLGGCTRARGAAWRGYSEGLTVAVAAADLAPAPPPALTATDVADTPSQPGVEVLASGPVHEAFAEPVSQDPSLTVVVTYEPPAPLQEAAPALKPADARAVWISGYWAWDDDRTDFIWVSGIWRVPPPNTRWVPGYWNPTPAGYQWVPGFWLATAAEPIAYLPAPPPTLEVGPVGVAPMPDAMWVQGCWIRSDSRYAWRPGFWALGRADWIWVPAHYAWTPRGYVFCQGYWDYSLGARGVLFAPVLCDLAFCTRPTFVYRPSIVVRLDMLITSLFSRPRYRHYYFGDYYDRRYALVGIHPWYEYRSDRRWYDPIGDHMRRTYLRKNPRWEADLRRQYDRRAAGREPRPARTLAAQRADLRRNPERARDALTAPWTDVAARRTPIRLDPARQAATHVFRRTTPDSRARPSEVRTRPATAPTAAPSVRTIRRPTASAPTPTPRVVKKPALQRPTAPTARTIRRPTAPAPTPTPRETKRPAPQRPTAPATRTIRRPTAPAPTPAPWAAEAQASSSRAGSAWAPAQSAGGWCVSPAPWAAGAQAFSSRAG